MNKEEFITEVKKLGIELTETQLEQFNIYSEYLIEKNKQYNLTAIKEQKAIYLKHFYDCITILNLMQIDENTSVLDIGTGAGFPGMVIKIIKPEIKLTLLDSNNKKITFLEELAKKLNLDNITFIHSRAEEYYVIVKDSFDYVLSRAVANLTVLSELCLPFVKKDGYFISMKGDALEEIEEAKYAIEVLGGKIECTNCFVLPIEKSSRTLIKIKKINKTSDEYPRLFGKILKYPLKKKSK